MSLARDIGLTYSQIGLLVALRQGMSTIVNLPAGMIVDTIGRPSQAAPRLGGRDSGG